MEQIRDIYSGMEPAIQVASITIAMLVVLISGRLCVKGCSRVCKAAFKPRKLDPLAEAIITATKNTAGWRFQPETTSQWPKLYKDDLELIWKANGFTIITMQSDVATNLSKKLGFRDKRAIRLAALKLKEVVFAKDRQYYADAVNKKMNKPAQA